MSALDRVRAGGRALDRRLASVSGAALLAALRAAGAVSEPEAAALGAPGGWGWARRLHALAEVKGHRTCSVLLDALERLEGPARPGPFDFFDPRRDAEPAHRSDCPCCRPQEEEEGQPQIREEGPEGDEGPEEEEGEPKNEEENPEEEEGEPENGEEGPEDEEGNPKNGEEGPEGEEGGGDEGPEGEEGDEGPEEEEGEPENEDEGPEGDEDGGGDED